MYFPGNILLYELTFRTSCLLKRWWIPARTPQIQKTLGKKKSFCTIVQLSPEIAKQEWWEFCKTLRPTFRDILVHEMYLENGMLLVKLWKVSDIFVITVLYCVWRRVFLGTSPSSTWISFLESLRVSVIEGENEENRTNVRRSERGDCGIVSYTSPVSRELHFWTNYHNTFGRDRAEGWVTWSNLILRTSTRVQIQVSKLKHECCQRQS